MRNGFFIRCKSNRRNRLYLGSLNSCTKRRLGAWNSRIHNDTDRSQRHFPSSQRKKFYNNMRTAVILAIGAIVVGTVTVIGAVYHVLGMGSFVGSKFVLASSITDWRLDRTSCDDHRGTFGCGGALGCFGDICSKKLQLDRIQIERQDV